MKSTVIKFTVAFSLAISAIFPLFAADWTGEDGNTYTALEYLQGNGNGYVLTDILPSCTDTVKMYFKTPSSGTLALNTLFSARDSQNKNNFSALLAYNKDTRRIRVDRNTVPSSPISTPEKTDAYNIDTEYSMEIYFGIGTKDGTLKVNGSSVALTANLGNGVYEVGSSLAFFALYNNGNINSQYRGQHTLYYFELFDCDGNLKNCLLPAMDKNGKKGLYDTITKKFYPQEGLEFTGGAIAEAGLGKRWTGRGGNNKMSTAENWEYCSLPTSGDDLDFSLAPESAKINADIVSSFGKITIANIVEFSGNFSVTSFNDTSKVAVGENSTVIVNGDLEFSNCTKSTPITYSIAEGGVFRVTGTISATGFISKGYLFATYGEKTTGTIAAKGLCNDGAKDGSGYPRFILVRNSDGYYPAWAIGSEGLKGRFYVNSKNTSSGTIVAESDFVISATILNRGKLFIDADSYNVTLRYNSDVGGIYGEGKITVSGGEIIVDYDINELTQKDDYRKPPFTVSSGATLTFNKGGNIGAGELTIEEGGTLEIAESATVTHNGDLSLSNGAELAFDFTDRIRLPQLALAAGKSVKFTEGESTNIFVKVSGDVWPVSGDKLLTTCGGFNADGVTVELAEGAPKWAQDVKIEDGNIVLTIKPMPTVITVR